MRSININRITGGGSKEEKEIYELTEEDTHAYRLLGQAMGINIDHCVILGSKHTDDFWCRVFGYRIIQNEKIAKMMFKEMKKNKPELESYMTVCFYERLAKQEFMFIPKSRIKQFSV